MLHKQFHQPPYNYMNVCVSTGLQVPLRQDEAGGQGYEQGRKRALNSAESASAVICAVETQFLYLLSWF